MADEAFALSPISARAAQPNEEDYDAISAAFMETSRGRWFLGEYARRNRNADTGMVLDAVARIEQTIAAQKQPAAEQALADALAAIRHAVDRANAAAVAALEGPALEERLTPIRKGARVIREISWRWREIGADGRICDLLDSQVSAIEGACGQIASSTDPQAVLRAAFDLIRAEIAAFDDGDAAAPEAAEAATAPSQQAVAESTADQIDAAPEIQSRPAEAIDAMVSAEPLEVFIKPVEAMVEVAETPAATSGTAPEAPEHSAEADAHDEAVLDLIALEMGAPDDSADIEETPEINGHATSVAELARAEPRSPPEPIMVAETLEPVAEKPQPMTVAQASPEPEPSLGSALIADGILRNRHASHSDPLAPLRRMSQIEKIALFS